MKTAIVCPNCKQHVTLAQCIKAPNPRVARCPSCSTVLEAHMPHIRLLAMGTRVLVFCLLALIAALAILRDSRLGLAVLTTAIVLPLLLVGTYLVLFNFAQFVPRHSRVLRQGGR